MGQRPALCRHQAQAQTRHRDADDLAPEDVAVLVRRAAGAVARTAIELLGGSYGRRIVVVAGPGNNGADWRVAALLSVGNQAVPEPLRLISAMTGR